MKNSTIKLHYYARPLFMLIVLIKFERINKYTMTYRMIILVTYIPPNTFTTIGKLGFNCNIGLHE